MICDCDGEQCSRIRAKIAAILAHETEPEVRAARVRDAGARRARSGYGCRTEITMEG